VDSMLAWYNSVITGGKRPDFVWNKVDANGIALKPLDTPKEVRLWQAHSPKARDFRVESLGKAYTSTVLTAQPDGTYFAQVDMPTEGFTAFFVEVAFESGIATAPFKFTTEVSILPDTLPFKWADAAAKYAATAPK
ncbi:MAG: PhoPQ-activated protein PqaA family protein, partial [Hyphomonadaceae bacterium]|nr:PhoPQ-activated protein PqaA family protein [Hyphomonadaceae bacterium]